MGTGRRQGRPEDSAAAVADVCAQLVEATRDGHADAFISAVGRWCEAVFADEGWGLWLWRGGAGFELRMAGGRPSPPQTSLEAVTASLRTEATSRELATGRPFILDARSSGPGTSAAAVAFGTPSRLLGVLVTFRASAQPPLGEADLVALAAPARLCASVLDLQPRDGDVAGRRDAATGATAFQASLLAELRDSLATVVGFAHTLIRSEHRLGRVDRRRYHEVIERQALALSGLVDDIALVTGVPAETAAQSSPSGPQGAVLSAELVDRLGSGVEFDMDPAVAGALPRGADEHALARALAGLVRVVGATGARVHVVAATSTTVGRVGVAALVDPPAAGQLVELVDAVRSGDENVVWSGTAPLAIAAAGVVARAHGGTVGASADGDVVRIWLDLPLPGATP